MKKGIIAACIGVMLFALGCSNPNGYNVSEYVTLGQYEGIEVSEADLEIDEEMLLAEIEYEMSPYKTKQSITGRSTDYYDIVNIDYVGKIDGVQQANATAQGHDLTIGSGEFIEGFEEGLVGHNIGETVTLNLQFPDEYHDAQVAGKDVVFEVKINSISAEVMPDFTDEFIASVTQHATYDAYEQAMRQQMRDEALMFAAWSRVLENCEIVAFPETLIQEYVDDILEEYEGYAAMSGITLEELLTTQLGTTEEEFINTIHSWAEEELGPVLVAEAIAKAMNVTISNEEYAAGLAQYLTDMGYEDAEQFKEDNSGVGIEEHFGKDELRRYMLEDKVLALIAEKAVVV